MGIDEAGRGAVIGPLVMGAFAIKDKGILVELRALGVRDSKLLSAPKREKLYKQIKKTLGLCTSSKISPSQIDKESLNDLEARHSAKLINKIGPKKVYIDVPSSGRGIERYCAKIEERCKSKTVIVGGNNMDQTNILVSAASIIAKEEREIAVRKLHKEYGNFGSGYPSDPRTIEWLKEWHKKDEGWPKIVRTKWTTIKRLI